MINTGEDKTVAEFSAISLIGSGNDTDGSIVSDGWKQPQGSAVTLTGTDSISASCTVPNVGAGKTLIFELEVTVNDGATARDIISYNYFVQDPDLSNDENNLALGAWKQGRDDTGTA